MMTGAWVGWQPLLENGGEDISHWFEPRTFQADNNGDSKQHGTAIALEMLRWYHPTRRMLTYFTPILQGPLGLRINHGVGVPV